VSEIQGLLGPAVGYVDLLDEHLNAKQAKEQEGPSRYHPLRPSASGFCARALAYSLNEFRGKAKYKQEVRAPSVQRLLNFGSSIEFHVLRMFQDIEYFSVKYKQQSLSFFRLNENEMIEGSIDFVFYIPGHKCIGDVKSKGDKYSSYRDSKWDEELEKLSRMKTVAKISDQAFWVDDLPSFLNELNDPFFADNFVQLNMYANNSFIQERGIDHAVIMRYNKNNSKMMEVRFRPSRKIADYVETKFKAIAQAVDVGSGPEEVEREYHLGTMRCAFCRFNSECYPHENAKKEYFASWPAKDWPKDTNRMDGDLAKALEAEYSSLKSAESAAEDVSAIESKLILALDKAQIRKVRFEDGCVYELKHLKSPRPHLELRRSKP
jgi:hypothetical protein